MYSLKQWWILKWTSHILLIQLRNKIYNNNLILDRQIYKYLILNHDYFNFRNVNCEKNYNFQILKVLNKRKKNMKLSTLCLWSGKLTEQAQKIIYLLFFKWLHKRKTIIHCCLLCIFKSI